MTGNTNLAQGMLAIIIGCKKPENRKYVGTVVTLGKYVKAGGIFPRHSTFRVGGAAVDGWIIEHDTLTGDDLFREGFGFWAPHLLMPLPPLAEHEQIKEKELEYV